MGVHVGKLPSYLPEQCVLVGKIMFFSNYNENEHRICLRIVDHRFQTKRLRVAIGLGIRVLGC